MIRILLLLIIVISARLHAEEMATRVVQQPILEYRLSGPGQSLEHSPAGDLILNAFIAYTHIGTDFGFHGPGERFIHWQDRRVCLALKGTNDWVGMWHSLAGMASANDESMNFDACYPSFILKEGQPQIRALIVKGMGSGQIKLEVKSATQEVLWQHTIHIESADSRPISLPVDASKMRKAKFLNWTAEPGAEVCLTSLSMEVALPPMDFDKYVLLASYAKLARCYAPKTGLVKDRAHIVSGHFDNIPATGFFALCTAMMSQPDVALVDEAFARETLRKAYASVTSIPKGGGLLPHFVRLEDGVMRIHAGTEFSTVDSALYYHSMLLAAEMLHDLEMKSALLKAIREIDFKKLRLPGGVIGHGIKDDGQTLLPHGWADWGGETALVVLLERLAGDSLPAPTMQRNGKVWQGTGFIPELQSLLYPDFDSTTKDALSLVNWRGARETMLSEQKGYFTKTLPHSQAAIVGYYGLSAGEGQGGISYRVGGVDLPDQTLVHPHYLLMSGALETDPNTIYNLLHRMEAAGYFSPWGLVENIAADGNIYLPMISSLNAAFETLGAYHLMAKNRKSEDLIYKAALNSSEIRSAMKIFYPAGVAGR